MPLQVPNNRGGRAKDRAVEKGAQQHRPHSSLDKFASEEYALKHEAEGTSITKFLSRQAVQESGAAYGSGSLSLRVVQIPGAGE